MHSGGLGLLIPKAQVGAFLAIANDSSNLFPNPDSKFTSSKSNCTVLNKWHIISVTWSFCYTRLLYIQVYHDPCVLTYYSVEAKQHNALI